MAEYDEDYDNPIITTTDQQHSQRGLVLLQQHKRESSNLLFSFGSIGSAIGGGGNNSSTSIDPTNISDAFINNNNATTSNSTPLVTTVTNTNEASTAPNNNNTRTSRCYSAKTRTVRRSANPTFNEEFRFEVADDTLLQDEPLLFHVWENSGSSGSTGATATSTTTNTSSNSIGLVYLDLNPLLMRTAIHDDYDGEENISNNAKEGNTVNKGDVGGSNSVEFNLKSKSSSGSIGGVDASGGGVGSADRDRAPGVIDGWFPLYDTLGGVRGELGLSIKLNFIGDGECLMFSWVFFTLS